MYLDLVKIDTGVYMTSKAGSMIASTTTLNRRKRKATTDMSDSPPKRVTRARAKANEEANPGIKTTKITTASGRIAAESRASAKAVIVTKRKLRGTDQNLDTDQPTKGADDVVTKTLEAPKSRGRPKKTSKESEPQNEKTKTVPRTRSRLGNDGLDIEASEPAIKKLKTRSKAKEEKTGKDEKVIQTGPTVQNEAKRSTRATTATNKSKAPASSILKAPTVRKKVTFDDIPQENKENVALLSEDTKKVQPRSTGLRAKPVRKPSTAKENIGGKGSLASKEKIGGSIDAEEIAQPLSPKKVTQVAKSNSISSEDELCGDKSPVRTLSKSPVKLPMSASRKQRSEISTMELASDAKLPVKLSSSSIMASPARRPPTSPFKDILKESPKKVNFDVSVALPSHSQPQNLHTLKVSPRRANPVGGSAMPSLTYSQTPPLTASLLQSPARRPVSPLKPASSSSALKPLKAAEQSYLPDHLEVTNNFKLPVFPPSKFFSSPLRAAKPRETPTKVHRMMTDEKARHTVETADRGEKRILEQKAFNMEDSRQFSAASSEVPSAVESLPTPCKDFEPVMPQEISTPQCTTPPGEPTYNDANLIGPACENFRSMAEESDSEDELQSTHYTTDELPPSIADVRRHENSRVDDLPATASATFSNEASCFMAKQRQLYSDYRRQTSSPLKTVDASMTQLALQLSSWLASSPDKNALRHDLNDTHNVSSPSKQTHFINANIERQSIQMSSPVRSTLFDDEMLVRDQVDTTSTEGNIELEYPDQAMFLGDMQQSEDSEEFGDENAIPIDPHLFSVQCTPRPMLETCTPSRIFQSNPREIHTVSKVPLRPAGDESPINFRRLRSRSFSGSSIFEKDNSRPSFVRSNTVISYSLGDDDDTDLESGCKTTLAQAIIDTSSVVEAPSTPSNNVLSNFATPFRTPRVGADAQIMRGAVVFVDVHTTEGADASGIFIELLTQMGARCVKQWTWNPRATASQESGQACSTQSDSLNEINFGLKVGITHVVYKDGGKRTLEKVRKSSGLVLCVGVGWVLDCERENRWLEESEYAVDTSIIPRGGHRRRKSMEPRMFANVNGSVIASGTPAKVSSDISPTKEFLNLSSPVSRRESTYAPSLEPQTPTATEYGHEGYDDGTSSWGSPTTPYYLSKGAKLVQQTCPPKRTLEPLFPLSGKIEDQPDESVRQRLMLARRKSLQWAPKVGSPLGRAVSYGI
ncbi:hypothetical protein MMC11_004916 [Xylographa trunciseda]|nr:hypothetical protein [Xylographa trunciseda]